jgi:translation initiation factor IF-3
MIGIVPIADAVARAYAVSLDLVEVASDNYPPVCKILDYSRYKYESKKKKQESKKKQKKIDIKEMKFKPNIGQNDFNVKMNKILDFLADGDKVKVSLMFKGREIIHKDKGLELFAKVISLIGEKGKVDAEPKFEGKQIIMVVSSNVTE